MLVRPKLETTIFMCECVCVCTSVSHFFSSSSIFTLADIKGMPSCILRQGVTSVFFVSIYFS